MIKIADKNPVVTRYKTSIISVFVTIMMIASMITLFRYASELSAFEQQNYDELKEQGRQIENQLYQPIKAITSIRDFANHYLNYPTELKIEPPKLIQEGEHYYLEKEQHDIMERRPHLSANITGIGSLTAMNTAQQQELAMANGLTPAFITAKNSSDVTDWFYYVSLNRFVSLYPWINRKNWQYRDLLLNNSHMQEIITGTEDINKLFWSKPYIDNAGKGLIIALGMAVYKTEQLVGAVVVDLNLAKLHDSLNSVVQDNQGYLLIDSKNTLIIHKTAADEAIKTRIPWQNVVPQGMKELSYQSIENKPDSFKINGWMVQKHPLSVNGWVLLKYQTSSDFSNHVFHHFAVISLMVFLGGLSLLVIIYLVTRNTFIKPTEEFINHIEHSARGDHGMVSPPKGWHHWFYIVEDIFSQNRSLLQQLKDQNLALDARVIEKTQALFEKSEQHQHDYAILRSVMDAIPDYLIFNDQQGKLIGCNLAFEQLVTQYEEDILGRYAGALIDNELGQALLAKNKEHDLNQAKHGIFQVITTQDKTYELFTTNFVNQEKQILGTIDIIRDVTKQHADNAALATAKDQAEYANQAKSQFLANMSHEIRTPINAIQGMYYLLENTGLSNQQKQHLDNAQSASVALLHLVDELLDLAKIESGNLSIFKESCCLDKIVNQAIKLNIGVANQKGLNLSVNIAKDVPHCIISDEIRLVQVLTNLLNNAVKFTHQGDISLNIFALSKTQNDKNIGQYSVRFVVQDSGIGIAKSKQERLFEAFIQADESMTREYGGSGLGLSICQKIIHLLGGDIVLESDVDQGAKFSFDLTFDVDGKNQPQAHWIEKSVQAYCYKQSLPEALSREMIAFDHQYSEVSTFEQLLHASLTVDHSDRNSLFFVEIQQLAALDYAGLSELLRNVNNKKEQSITLVVYEETPPSSSKSPNENKPSTKRLDEYQIPYVICEAPFYRYSLMSLLQETFTCTPSEANKNDKSSGVQSNERNLAGTRILLVEDNLVNQLVAKELLNSIQAEVVVAENGQQAIDELTQQSFDVVLMDIQMPVMDGLTATKYLRADGRFDDLPIIAMTAHARQEDKESSMAAGMTLHIAKPVKAEVLFNSIFDVLSK